MSEVRPEQHGTNTGYQKGCRCEPCRKTERDRKRRSKEADPEQWRAKGRETARVWRATHPERAREAKLRAVRKKQDLVNTLKGTTCQSCGRTFPSSDLHCHHRNPSTKRFALSEASNHSYAAIRTEFAKCDVLCEPCHVKRHAVLYATTVTGGTDDPRCTCTGCGEVFSCETWFARHRVGGRCLTVEEMVTKGFREHAGGLGWQQLKPGRRGGS